jgi:hypothetical protein
MTYPALAPNDNSHHETILVLPEPIRARDLAEAARETAFEFVTNAQRWGSAELAMWLMGPYASLTRYSTHEGRSGRSTRPMSLLGGLDVERVERVIKRAHAEVVETLERMKTAEGAARFTLTMFSRGFVVPFEDRNRTVGWLPTDVARRLSDRVLSLVAADYLTRPEDYVAEPISNVFVRLAAPGPQAVEIDVSEEDQRPTIPIPRPRLSTIPDLLEEA